MQIQVTKNPLKRIGLLITLFFAVWLSGCTTPVKDGPPAYHIDISKIPNAKPKRLPESRYGNPSSYVVNGRRYYVRKTASGYNQRGIASWYGTKFQGKLTSTRKPYNMLSMTGASPVLPIPCFVRVTNLENGKSIIVKINDRGPFESNRILDLSYVAAKKLGYAKKGTALVQVTAISVASNHLNNPQLYLQLGAFRQFNHAKILKNRAQSIIHQNVSIHKGIYKHATIYRVQIGPLIDVDESDHLKEELKKRGLGQAMAIIS